MTAEVLFEEIVGPDGHLGIILLNRPEALNALNHAMILSVFTQLKKWVTQSHIKAIVIRKASGRAFCAGGDVRLTYERYHAKDPALMNFFRDEYALNAYIFHYPKPYIALLDGITMGGGVGISIHGSHRIGTENLIFAMPETGIGFFPDVGGTYFLPRLKSYMGYYLGLIGARIPVQDALFAGLIQYYMPEKVLDNFISALAQFDFKGEAHQAVNTVIQDFKQVYDAESLLQQVEACIQTCFSKNYITEILHCLQQDTTAFAAQAYKELLKKSPTSLYVTLGALQKGKHLSFDDCMKQEYRLVTHFLENSDFLEGIRAVIIDKDQQPKWQPATIEKVNPEIVEHYFEALNDELQLSH